MGRIKKNYIVLFMIFILTISNNIFNKVYAIKPGGTAVPGDGPGGAARLGL